MREARNNQILEILFDKNIIVSFFSLVNKRDYGSINNNDLRRHIGRPQATTAIMEGSRRTRQPGSASASSVEGSGALAMEGSRARGRRNEGSRMAPRQACMARQRPWRARERPWMARRRPWKAREWRGRAAKERIGVVQGGSNRERT
jgi:hypothetical protein